MHPQLHVLTRASMDEHLAEPATISGLCAAMCCPIHTLERAFHKIHGTNPRQFLNFLRLTRLRRILLRHETEEISVTEAALQCGLTHLGRVAVRYKAMFGKSPSVTLKTKTPKTVASLNR